MTKSTGVGKGGPGVSRLATYVHGQYCNGAEKTPEFNSWLSMHNRCSQKSHRSYPNYGGRGICVCDEWKTFPAFLADMGCKPTPAHTIERVDTDGAYCKENCRWATNFEQQANKRSNVVVSAFGETLHLAEWARRCGVLPETISRRIRAGWSHEKAVGTRSQKAKG